MLKTRIEKITTIFELLYNEIRTENNEILKMEKSNKVKIDKIELIELIKDMEISLRISVDCIEKSEYIADTVSEGYFSQKRFDKKISEKQLKIKESKERKRVNNSWHH